MAFTGMCIVCDDEVNHADSVQGYVFKDLQEISPFLEDCETGPSVLWAKKQGKETYPHRPQHHLTCSTKPYGWNVLSLLDTLKRQVKLKPTWI